MPIRPSLSNLSILILIGLLITFQKVVKILCLLIFSLVLLISVQKLFGPAQSAVCIGHDSVQAEHSDFLCFYHQAWDKPRHNREEEEGREWPKYGKFLSDYKGGQNLTTDSVRQYVRQPDTLRRIKGCLQRSWENPTVGSIWVLVVENRLTPPGVGSHGTWASYTTNVLEPTDLDRIQIKTQIINSFMCWNIFLIISVICTVFNILSNDLPIIKYQILHLAQLQV